jgi:KaiC/GvpD/RAD55 family RecA-like ATPase
MTGEMTTTDNKKDEAEILATTTARLETIILKNLIKNEEFSRKVLPFIHADYFQNEDEAEIYKSVSEFIVKYNTSPTFEALILSVKNSKKLSEDRVKNCLAIIKSIWSIRKETSDFVWITEQTEKFCKDQAIYNAVKDSIFILDGKSKKKKESIPSLLSDALAVSFDSHVGHDYVADMEHRWEYYQRKDIKIPFHHNVKTLNKITNGGLSPKTLNVILGGTGVGKSLILCDWTTGWILDGYKVLYCTMEMAEEKIAERIDANIVDVMLDDLKNLPKDIFVKRFEKQMTKTKGNLIIKEYPTAEPSVVHFESLLKELKIKKNFIPDIIIVDYLNICSSARIRMGANVNSYTYIKSIAEELRGMAVRHNVPVVSATQSNRVGFTDSDPGMQHTSESFGLPATVDFFIAAITNEQLEKLGQYLIKQLKNRYRDVAKDRKFGLGVDKPKMRLYDLEAKAQKAFSGSDPIKGEEEAPDIPDGDSLFSGSSVTMELSKKLSGLKI